MSNKKKGEDKKNKLEKDKSKKISKKEANELSIIQKRRNRTKRKNLPEIPPIQVKMPIGKNVKSKSDESDKFEAKLKKIEKKITEEPSEKENKTRLFRPFTTTKTSVVKKAELFKEPKKNQKEVKTKSKKQTIDKEKNKVEDKSKEKVSEIKPKISKKVLWISLGIIVGIIIIALIIYFLTTTIKDKVEEEVIENITIIKEDITVNGRTFIFSKRSDVKKGPVIIFLHGGLQSSTVWFEDNFQAEIVKTAIDRGYAVVAPDSTMPLCENVKQWDYTQKSSDLVFFDDIFNWIWYREDLDNDKVYVAGMSIGGFMASRLANHYGRNIEAIAVHSGGDADFIWVSPSNNCYIEYDFNNSNINKGHARTLIIHGSDDEIIPYEVATNYYTLLKNSGVGVKFIPKVNGGHSWFNDYNDYVLGWFS